MIIQYHHVTIRYNDENIIALKEDGPDVVVCLKNGNFHRLKGPQAEDPVSLAHSPKNQSPTEAVLINSNTSLTKEAQKRTRRKRNQENSCEESSEVVSQEREIAQKPKSESENQPPKDSPFVSAHLRKKPAQKEKKKKNEDGQENNVGQNFEAKAVEPEAVQDLYLGNLQKATERNDERYENFIDQCLMSCPPMKSWHYDDQDIKHYLLARIKNFTLTVDLEEKNESKQNKYRLKIIQLISEYRENPPLDILKHSNRNPKHLGDR